MNTLSFDELRGMFQNGTIWTNGYELYWYEHAWEILSRQGKADYSNSREYYEVWLNMPRIETDTNQDLKDIMKSLGMGNSFDNGHGFMNFCHLGNDEENSDQCWISMMRQKAHLKLDEMGTEAAAATVVSLVDEAMQRYVEFIADRPFLYIISERSTGSIFFIGQTTALLSTSSAEHVAMRTASCLR